MIQSAAEADASHACPGPKRRGGGGGLRLARAPEAITVGEVMRALEARHALVECFRADGGACALTPGRGLKGRLAAAREAFLRDLDATTLAEIAAPAPAASAQTGRAASGARPEIA